MRDLLKRSVATYYRMRTAVHMLSAVAFASSAPFYGAATTMPSSVPAFASCMPGRVRGGSRSCGATVVECFAFSSSTRGPAQLPRRRNRSSGIGSGSCSRFIALRAQRSVGNGGRGGNGGSGGGGNSARGFFSSSQSVSVRPGWVIPSGMVSSPTATRGRCLRFRQHQQLSLAHGHNDTPFSTVSVTGAALGSAGGSVGGSVRGNGERRRRRGTSSGYRGCGPLMMASVTNTDIMKEFATAAAEAASSTQSPLDVASSGDGAGPEVQKQEARAGDVNDERPTGYK